MKKNLISFILFLIFFQTGNGANEHFYLEIKKSTIEIGTFSDKKFKRKMLASFPKTEIDHDKVSQIFALHEGANILFYFHAMWGGVQVYHKNSLKKLDELENLDKVISIIWHTDGPGYKGSWKKAIHQGEEISSLFKTLTSIPNTNFSVLCHSMGHRIFQGVIKEIDEPCIRFQSILFAAADLDIDVFSKDLEKLPDMSKQIIVLVHEKDWMLKVSRLIHKRDRLGLHGIKHKEQLSLIKNLELIDVTRLKKAGSISMSNHLYFKKHKAVFSKIETILNRV